MEENPRVARAILDKAMMASRAREAARKARESVRRKTALESLALDAIMALSKIALATLGFSSRYSSRRSFTTAMVRVRIQPVSGNSRHVGQDAQRGESQSR